MKPNACVSPAGSNKYDYFLVALTSEYLHPFVDYINVCYSIRRRHRVHINDNFIHTKVGKNVSHNSSLLFQM